jgi:sialic acid synthase
MKIVAEIGCNHQGNFDHAISMILAAKNSGANYIKLQKRNNKECLPHHMKNVPHPNPCHSFGKTYFLHRESLELTLSQHKEISVFCNKQNIGYACSVWDLTSAADIISLQPDYIKIPSAQNTNFDLLSFVYNNFTRDVHISLGMTTAEERHKIFSVIDKYKDRTVVYWTTSEYPVPFNRIYLKELLKLKNSFPRVGFSGHHLGIAIDIAAYALGIEFLERHFTLDRTWKGSDHAASLEPSGMQKLVRDILATEQALAYKDVEMTDVEKEARHKLKTHL